MYPRLSFRPGILPLLLGLLAFLASLFGGTASAQNEGFMQNPRERLKAMRVAFITQRVELSASQAQRFWPVFNELQDKLDDLDAEKKKLNHNTLQDHRSGELTDQQLRESMARNFEIEQEVLNLRKTYHDRFLGIISPKQVASLYMAEQAFKKFLIEELQRLQQQRQQRRRGGNR